jgi:S-adenosyl-L-methionine hydrolase (adenosine-forming)
MIIVAFNSSGKCIKNSYLCIINFTRMTIVTVTSDWKNCDYYTGGLRGSLISLSSGLSVVEVTNSIPCFDVLQEIFILRSVFRHFPESSIHLLGVMSEPSPNAPMVIVFGDGHYFVGVNDGRFSLLFENPPSVCFEILKFNEMPFSSFMSLELFREAVDIILTNSFEKRTKICNLKRESSPGVVHNPNLIVGRVVYSDSLGNAITNIEKRLFDSIHKGRDFTIFVQGPYTKINRISRGYNDSSPGELIALFNSLGYLELAVNQGNITTLESLNPSSEIRIKFTTNIKQDINETGEGTQ